MVPTHGIINSSARPLIPIKIRMSILAWIGSLLPGAADREVVPARCDRGEPDKDECPVDARPGERACHGRQAPGFRAL